MDPVAERLLKLREERQAREKARIEKLRELNLKKYNKANEPINKNSANVIKKPIKSETSLKPKANESVKDNISKPMKRPISAPTDKSLIKDSLKSKAGIKIDRKNNTIDTKAVVTEKNTSNVAKSISVENKIANTATNKKLPSVMSTSKNINDKKGLVNGSGNGIQNKNYKKPGDVKITRKSVVNNNTSRKSIVNTDKLKSNIPKQNSLKTISDNNSVFERLYQHKITQNAHVCDVEKLKNDPKFFKKLQHNTGLILNKRYTVFDKPKAKTEVPVRRSISAVHLKRISKHELGNCIHKYTSIGDKLNNIHLENINEDECIKEDKIVSAVKSERKKVKFMTPINFNTPRPEELQNRLKAWLQKRGKSLDSYQHLQCFGINHLPNRLNFNNKIYDDEDKENISVNSESDNESYIETMNEEPNNVNKWRSASIVSDSVNLNETQDTSSTYSDALNMDEVVIGALNDLTELLREGYAWEQCARWLRAIRERFPSARRSAAYWECRAALEERRGDLPASVQCWEEAIAKGTEQSVVEANLDQLLDKFMQLKISPKGDKTCRQVDPKLLDIKNVFKSTIIRFAVQQAKLREANQCSPKPKFCVTPVRRSGRLSAHWTGRKRSIPPSSLGNRTPLQVCTSVRQAGQLIGEELQFIPNENLIGTP